MILSFLEVAQSGERKNKKKRKKTIGSMNSKLWGLKSAILLERMQGSARGRVSSREKD